MLTEALVNQILRFLTEKEASSRQPFNRFTDTSAQEAVELTFRYVFHISLYRRLSYAGHPPVKSAFFVTKPEIAHIVKIHAILTDHSPLEVEMFESREAAAKWLGVSLETLEY